MSSKPYKDPRLEAYRWIPENAGLNYNQLRAKLKQEDESRAGLLKPKVKRKSSSKKKKSKAKQPEPREIPLPEPEDEYEDAFARMSLQEKIRQLEQEPEAEYIPPPSIVRRTPSSVGARKTRTSGRKTLTVREEPVVISEAPADLSDPTVVAQIRNTAAIIGSVLYDFLFEIFVKDVYHHIYQNKPRAKQPPASFTKQFKDFFGLLSDQWDPEHATQEQTLPTLSEAEKAEVVKRLSAMRIFLNSFYNGWWRAICYSPDTPAVEQRHRQQLKRDFPGIAQLDETLDQILEIVRQSNAEYQHLSMCGPLQHALITLINRKMDTLQKRIE